MPMVVLTFRPLTVCVCCVAENCLTHTPVLFCRDCDLHGLCSAVLDCSQPTLPISLRGRTSCAICPPLHWRKNFGQNPLRSIMNLGLVRGSGTKGLSQASSAVSGSGSHCGSLGMQ